MGHQNGRSWGRVPRPDLRRICVRGYGEGRFVTPGIVPWTPHYELLVICDGFRTQRVPLRTSGVPRQPIYQKIVLKRADGGGVVVGRVTVNGQPAAAYLNWQANARKGGANSGPEGEYRLEDVEPGRIELGVFLAKRHLNQIVGGRDVVLDVVAGREVRHDFDLRAALEQISGRVVREDGEPVRSVLGILAVGQTNRARSSARIQERGEFAIELGDDGDLYDLIVHYANEAITRRGVPVGAENVEIVLPTVGRLRVRVRDEATGVPLKRHRVWWRRGGGGAFEAGIPKSASPGPASWLDIEVAAGTLDVMFRADQSGYVAEIVEGVIVPPLGSTEVEVSLHKGIELDLRLAPGMDPPPRDWAILLLEDAAWDEVRHWKEGGGNYWEGGELFPEFSVFERLLDLSDGVSKLRGLSPGKYRFKVFPSGITIEPSVIQLERDDDSREIEITWARD